MVAFGEMKEDELAFARNMLPVKKPLPARGRYHRWLKDGVYRVTSHPHNGRKPFVAGFVIKGGKVVQCAPIIAFHWGLTLICSK